MLDLVFFDDIRAVNNFWFLFIVKLDQKAILKTPSSSHVACFNELLEVQETSF